MRERKQKAQRDAETKQNKVEKKSEEKKKALWSHFFRLDSEFM